MSVVCGGLCCGCGGSGATSSGQVSTRHPVGATPIAHKAGGSSPSRNRQGTHAQFVGFAQAVNLRPSDLPGFLAKKRHGHSRVHNKAFEGGSQYRRCVKGAGNSKTVFKASSAGFEAMSNGFTPPSDFHFESTHSQVEIAPSAARARRELATFERVFASRAAVDCLRRVFNQLGAQGQPTRVGKATMRILVGDMQLAPVRASLGAATADGSAGLSMRMNVTYILSFRGRTLTIPAPLHFDVLAILVGRGEVTLVTETLGEAFPPQREARLFSLLVSRAVAARRQFPAIAQ